MTELRNLSDGISSEGLFNSGMSAHSPEFLLVDEESSSTYPLLTPSPTTEFEHPLALDTPPVLAYERQLSPSSIDTDLSSIPTLSSAAPSADYGALASTLLPPVTAAGQSDKNLPCKLGDPHGGMGSSSSSSSVLQDAAASAQLLNPHHYLGLASDVTCQENGGIKPSLCGITLGTKKSPQDFFFLAWNWPFIRKCCFWGMMSLTVACVCVIITYITTLPTRCDPPRSWHQGSLIYEIFPGSFYDSDGDGVGDLKGISAKVHYLESMGVRGVRLNSIFPSEHYPEHYYDVENLTQIEPALGGFADFRFLVKTLHEMNISLILDLPLGSFFKHLEDNKPLSSGSHAHHVIINNHILSSVNSNKSVPSYLPDPLGLVSEVLKFWLNQGVDGFYMKDFESLIHDNKFQQNVREWKGIMKSHSQGFDKILICSEKVVKTMENSEILSAKLATVLTHFDLVDYHIEISEDLKSQIDAVQHGVMFSRPGYPWPLWTLGGVDTTRLASRLSSANASLAAVLVGMMLPGTPSIFYGDELGLDNKLDSEKDFEDISHVHQLVMMQWRTNAQRALQWIPRGEAHLPLDSARWVSEIAALRDASPSIYMHAVWRDNSLVPNCQIKYIDKTMVVLERLYPRRHSYVIVANVGHDKEVRDFSKLFYGGHIVLSTGDQADKYLNFQQVILYPEYISSNIQESQSQVEAVEFDTFMALDFFAGCVGGCAGVVVGHPFDTVKVKLQLQDYKNPVYRGTWDCFAKIIKAESVAGVYRGVTPPMAGVALVNAIVFGVYGNVQRSMSEPNSLRSHFLAGAAAGLAQSVVVSPVELVKSTMQANNRYCSPWDCFTKTFKQSGASGVFKGLGVTGVRDFLGYGLYFATYEALTRSSLENHPIGTASMLMAGGLSGTVSWIFTYPLDVVKTRLQVDPEKYFSFADCLRKSVQSEGLVCLTRGLTPTLIRAFPTNAVTFTVVTWVFRLADLGFDSLENIKTEVVSSLESLTIPDTVITNNLIEGNVSGISSSCSSSHSISRLDNRESINTSTEIDKGISRMPDKDSVHLIQQSITENSDFNQDNLEFEDHREILR